MASLASPPAPLPLAPSRTYAAAAGGARVGAPPAPAAPAIPSPAAAIATPPPPPPRPSPAAAAPEPAAPEPAAPEPAAPEPAAPEPAGAPAGAPVPAAPTAAPTAAPAAATPAAPAAEAASPPPPPACGKPVTVSVAFTPARPARGAAPPEASSTSDDEEEEDEEAWQARQRARQEAAAAAAQWYKTQPPPPPPRQQPPPPPPPPPPPRRAGSGGAPETWDASSDGGASWAGGPLPPSGGSGGWWSPPGGAPPPSPFAGGGAAAAAAAAAAAGPACVYVPVVAGVITPAGPVYMAAPCASAVGYMWSAAAAQLPPDDQLQLLQLGQPDYMHPAARRGRGPGCPGRSCPLPSRRSYCGERPGSALSLAGAGSSGVLSPRGSWALSDAGAVPGGRGGAPPRPPHIPPPPPPRRAGSGCPSPSGSGSGGRHSPPATPTPASPSTPRRAMSFSSEPSGSLAASVSALAERAVSQPPGSENQSWAWLVEAILSQVVAHLAAPASLRAFRSVCRHWKAVSDHHLRALAPLALYPRELVSLFPRLQVLELTRCANVRNRDLFVLAASGLPLRCLTVGEDAFKPWVTNKGLVSIGRMTTLRSLALHDCNSVTNNGLAELAGLINLNSLSLRGCKKVTNSGLEILQVRARAALGKQQPAAPQNARWRADASGCSERPERQRQPPPAPHPAPPHPAPPLHQAHTALTSLNLHGCKRISDRGIAMLTRLPLRALSLGLTRVRDEGMQYLARLTQVGGGRGQGAGWRGGARGCLCSNACGESGGPALARPLPPGPALFPLNPPHPTLHPPS
jgi:hypothetical protein